MAELSEVITGLRCVSGEEINCAECPYQGAQRKYGLSNHYQIIAVDAINLLKAQEPRVMTYDEMIKAEICFLEVKGIKEVDPFIRYEVDDKSYWSSPYTNNEDNPFELLAEQEEYLINARCWTSRPTEKQREAVKWNG